MSPISEARRKKIIADWEAAYVAANPGKAPIKMTWSAGWYRAEGSKWRAFDVELATEVLRGRVRERV